jgi:hypothetical protein
MALWAVIAVTLGTRAALRIDSKRQPAGERGPDLAAAKYLRTM